MDVIAFDCESTMFSMLPPELVLTGFHGSNWDIFFDTAQQCVDFIQSCKRSTCFVAHNLQFDFYMIFKDTSIRKTFQVQTININDQFPRFAVFNQLTSDKVSHARIDYSIYFIDLMNFLKLKLVELMKVYTPHLLAAKESKITMHSLSGIEKEISTFDFERNKADIEATYYIFFTRFFKPYTTKKGVEKLRMSISSIAFNDLLERTGYKWLGADNRGKIRPKWLVKCEQSSYHGGIVWLNPKFKEVTCKNAKYYDINSMYPFIMKHMKVPNNYIGYETYSMLDMQTSARLIEAAFRSNDTFTLFCVTVVTNMPCLPAKRMSDKGYETLQLPVGEIKGFYTECELYPHLKKGKFKSIQVHKAYRYSAERGTFAPFVDHWYGIKQKATEEKHALELIQLTDDNRSEIEYKIKKCEVLILESKLMLNSAYGRFGMRKRETVVIDYRPEELLDLNVAFLTERNTEIRRTLKKQIYQQYLFQDLIELGCSEYIETVYTCRVCQYESNYMDSDAEIICPNCKSRYFTSKTNKWTLRHDYDLIYLQRKSDNEAYNSVTIIASIVTSSAAAYLLDGLDLNNTIYTDTDSQVRMDDFPTGEELGAWKIEQEGEFTGYDKKDYIFNGRRKLKGVPKSAIAKTDTLFSYLKVIRPREAMRRKLPPFTQLYQEKVIRRGSRVKKKKASEVIV